MRAPSGIVSYVLDSDSRLVVVGGDWDLFAIENNARELLPPQPLGRPLKSFIADHTTSHLYDAIFEKVKRTGKSVSFPIRCDAPTIRRQLQLTVRYERDCFILTSAQLSAVARDAMPVGTAQRSDGASEPLVSCSWCKRISVDGGWFEIEEAVARLRVFEGEPTTDITHGICEGCLERMESLIAR